MAPPPSREDPLFLTVAGHRLHCRCLGSDRVGSTVVFLHEGLGSVELWRDFPRAVVDAAHRPGLVYSRYGNGRSDPLTGPRRVDYMHEEALAVLPEVVAGRSQGPPVLVGHSDGASIAIVYAGSGHPVAGLVLIAPHVFVEPEGLRQIAATRDGFAASSLPARMAKYHVDAEATFRGWADAWLHPDFRSWNIEAYLPGIRCPVLLVQGDQDEYGTLRQLDAIEEGAAGPVQRVIVPGARHSPHLSHGDLVTPASVGFIERL